MGYEKKIQFRISDKAYEKLHALGKKENVGADVMARRIILRILKKEEDEK